MTDISQPTVIRCTVSFAQCLYGNPAEVEGITAQKAKSCEEVFKLLDDNKIPVMVDEDCCSLASLKPTFVVDAILAKRNLGTTRDMAPITIALGPGFTAGEDCDAVYRDKTEVTTSDALSTTVSPRPTQGSPVILLATPTSVCCALPVTALCITTSSSAIS